MASGRRRVVTSSAWALALAGSFACSSSSSSGSGGGPDSAGGGPDARAPTDAPGSSDVISRFDGPSLVDARPASDAVGSPLDGGDALASGDGGIQDAGIDAKAVDPGTLLASCAGTSMGLTVSELLPYVDVPVGSEMGEFLLDYGSSFSTIDLSAFASPGPTTTGCIRQDVGGLCSVSDVAFFSAPETVELTASNYSGLGGSLRQAGILATDITGGLILTLDYAGGHVYGSTAAAFCSTSALEAAGLVALSTTGFFDNDTSSLEPFTDVDDAGTPGYTVPDIPTVPVQIAGVLALAQLDTGYRDTAMSFSVNINQAFFAALEAAHPGSRVRNSSKDEMLTTCVEGVSESVLAYDLASGVSFGLGGTANAPARSYTGATIFLKGNPDAAVTCGGISTWSVPAAQVGASFYVDMQTIVFDPFGDKVWIPKN